MSEFAPLVFACVSDPPESVIAEVPVKSRPFVGYNAVPELVMVTVPPVVLSICSVFVCFPVIEPVAESRTLSPATAVAISYRLLR